MQVDPQTGVFLSARVLQFQFFTHNTACAVIRVGSGSNFQHGDFFREVLGSIVASATAIKQAVQPRDENGMSPSMCRAFTSFKLADGFG